jgi:hypothetical protein
MLVTKPTLHPIARAALLEIQAAGVEVTPDMVLWVHESAVRIGKHPPRPVAEVVDWPMPCGGALLYPLTFGAVEWLTRLPERVRNDDRTIGFAMAKGHEPETLARLDNSLKAIHAILKWAAGLRCSAAALEAAVNALIGTDETVEVKDAGTRKRAPVSAHWGSFVLAACRHYPGTTPEYWTWQVSRDRVYEALADMNAAMPDEGQQVTPHEIESNIALRSVVEHIIAEAKGATNV